MTKQQRKQKKYKKANKQAKNIRPYIELEMNLR